MIEDHTERIERLQRALAEEHLERGDVLNLPGRSLACKVDPYYYLALYPAVVEHLSRHAGMFQGKALDALVRTGNLLTHPQSGAPSLFLNVIWNQSGTARRARLEVCFLHNSFVDRALVLYARQEGELPVADFSVDASDKSLVEAFLAGKTALADLAYRE